MASGNLLYDSGSSNQCSELEGKGGVGGREVQEGRDICIPVADSCWCMAETSTILKSNYPPIKNINFKKDKFHVEHILSQFFFFKKGLSIELVKSTWKKNNLWLTSCFPVIPVPMRGSAEFAWTSAFFCHNWEGRGAKPWSIPYWESQFLGRLIRSLGVPKERGVWNSQRGRKDKLFFFLHIP